MNLVKPKEQWKGKGKAEKSDIAVVIGAHVDIDIESDLQPINKQMDMILGELERLNPTHYIMSGGGWQAICQYTTPVVLTGDPRQVEELEAANEALIARLDGDPACKDISRLLRLPFTWNIPGEKKKTTKPWRTTVESYWLNEGKPGPTFDVGFVTPLEPGQRVDRRKQSKRKAKHQVDVGTNFATLPQVNSKEDIAAYSKMTERLFTIMEKGRIAEEPKEKDDTRSAWLFDFCTNMLRAQVPVNVIAGIITNARWKISESVLQLERGAKRYVEHTIGNALEVIDQDRANGGAGGHLLNSFPYRVLRYGKCWYRFFNDRYIVLEDEVVDQQAFTLWPDIEMKELNLYIREAKARSVIEQHTGSPPMWLDGRKDLVVPVRNGLVDIRSGALAPIDDNYFTLNRLPVEYDPNAGEPEMFNKFIREIVPEDAVEVLFDIIADLLLPDFNKAYIYVFVGGKGCGKTTLGNILLALLGLENVGRQGINELGGPFGLQVYIGKNHAWYYDVDLKGSKDSGVVVSRLKALSGGDPLQAARKGTTHAEQPIKVRCLMFGNGVPPLPDPSGALQERLKIIAFPFKFRNTKNEVEGLAEQIIAKELPAILKQAIERRRKPLNIYTPPSAERWVAHTKDTADRWLAEKCVIEDGAEVNKDALWDSYRAFYEAEHGDTKRALDKHGLTEKLDQSLGDKVRLYRPKDEQRRSLPWAWEGIRLVDDDDAHKDAPGYGSLR